MRSAAFFSVLFMAVVQAQLHGRTRGHRNQLIKGEENGKTVRFLKGKSHKSEKGGTKYTHVLKSDKGAEYGYARPVPAKPTENAYVSPVPAVTPTENGNVAPVPAATPNENGFAFPAPAVTPTAAPVAAPTTYTLPDLPYPYEALEPYIDTKTMTIHHDKHHATYVANINKALQGQPVVPILELQENAIAAGTAIRNNAGGHYNHAFFWSEMAPPDQARNSRISPQLEELIVKSFGSLDEFKAQFEARAAPGALFGSGWVWLTVSKDGTELKLVGTPNQDNPLMKGVDVEISFPILGLDVWEHAYYLKYQNLRTQYISNWWNVVNWDKVSENAAYVIENHVGVSF